MDRQKEGIMSEVVTITFEAAGIGPETIIRVRRLLKGALRQYGLRCTDIAAGKPSPEARQSNARAIAGAGVTDDTAIAIDAPSLALSPVERISDK